MYLIDTFEHSEETLLTPVCVPRICDNPVLYTIFNTPTNDLKNKTIIYLYIYTQSNILKGEGSQSVLWEKKERMSVCKMFTLTAWPPTYSPLTCL